MNLEFDVLFTILVACVYDFIGELDSDIFDVFRCGFSYIYLTI